VKTPRDYPLHLRWLRFHGAETRKTVAFLTSQTALPALTVCGLYKRRWQGRVLDSDASFVSALRSLSCLILHTLMVVLGSARVIK